MNTWRDKAHKLISDAATIAYNQSNTASNGKPYKKHHPYSLPLWVGELIECLGSNDETQAKAIFNHQYLRDF